MKIPDKVKESELYKLLTYDITMQDRVSPARYARMQTQRAYKFVSDWAGLASNKIIFGMYMDSQVGMLPGTSLLARGFSLGAHTATSPLYTWAREFIYKKGNITPDRNIVMRQGAELLAFNAVQTPLYVAQISAAMAIRAYLDPAVEFEPMN
ncbi:TPA: hypothetical protein HA278_08575, partial [Candidatus Woesearchaeota archaeon]|nr:hypothetical protein [Candidatus Woesearchaeota archaeon]